MRVLFLKDQFPTARAGDIRQVKNGYARNYLIPQKIAVLATAHELRRAEKLRAEAEKRRLLEIEEIKVLAAELESTPIELKVRSGPTGRLYGSVSNSVVAARLTELTGRTVQRKRVRVPEQIRVIGEYRVPVNLGEDIWCNITLSVVSEDELDPTLLEDEEVAGRSAPYAITDSMLESGEVDMHGWEEPVVSEKVAEIAGKMAARGSAQIRLVHGKGEGTLRKSVRDRLTELRDQGTIAQWGPGRQDGDTNADNLEAVSWFAIS